MRMLFNLRVFEKKKIKHRQKVKNMVKTFGKPIWFHNEEVGLHIDIEGRGQNVYRPQNGKPSID